MTTQLPPEWHLQEWLWVGFPHDTKEWPQHLNEAQRQIAAFASAVAESGLEVRLIVRDEENEAIARSLVSQKVTIQQRTYGDIWLRDTGPLTMLDQTGTRIARRFGFNGWGGKFIMPGDETIGDDLARDAELPIERSDWILEGGAIETDGTGLAMTTEQCLLNPNRNPQLTRADVEERLTRDLGLTSILWLGNGLSNDHTDGHIDNLARFVAPGTVAIPVATDADDPNIEIYADAASRARAAGLTICPVPSPGRIVRAGQAEPASYMNFVITNHLIIVPTFNSRYDDDAIAAIAALFPGRDTIGLAASAVITGGGGFHCASQQMPAK